MKDVVINSDLISEWNFKRNNELGFYPDKITLGSGKKVWWKCGYCGHEWATSVCQRNRGRGCPECAKRYQKSLQEMKLYYYIKKYFPDAISGYVNKDCNITEIDIYIPNIHVGIEYDGANWHKNIHNDLVKDIACKLCNISLIRVREPKCPKYESNCTFLYLENLSDLSLSSAISSILNILNIDNADINFDRDSKNINNLITYNRLADSLANKNPEIAAEWHPTKNGNLKPENVFSCSEKRIWWLCKNCGNEYSALVSNRTNRYSGCPKCAKNLPKQVYCPELDMIFTSMGEAERVTGVYHGHISKCINGKLNSAGKNLINGEKLHWEEIN